MKQTMTRLAKIRKHKRISYLDIEKHTGIPFARMKQLESGEEAITVDELEKLLSFYQMTYDQVRKYKGWRRLAKPALAVLASGLLLFGAVYFWPGLIPANSGTSTAPAPFEGAAPGEIGPANAGTGDAASGETASVETEPGLAASDGAAADPELAASGPNQAAADPEQPAAEHSTTGQTATGQATSGQAASAGGAKPAADSEAAPSAAENPMETVVFRFWGNIPYHAAALPQPKKHEHEHERDHERDHEREHERAQDSARTIDVYPIRYLDDNPPGWLTERNREHLILNFGTSEVWTPTTKQAYEALRQDGYQVIGLGKTPDVYEPLILKVNGRNIGFLSLTGLIRNADEIALPNKVGLPRAYRTDEVTKAVTEAKQKADYLFVLIDWGRTYGLTPNTSQKLIGEAILKAGADCVIGNRPEQAQDIVLIDGKPLFYALGHSVSDGPDGATDGSYNLMVEAAFTTELEQLTVHVGKLSEGTLQFALTEDDRQQIQAAFGDKGPWPEYMQVVW